MRALNRLDAAQIGFGSYRGATLNPNPKTPKQIREETRRVRIKSLIRRAANKAHSINRRNP